MSEAREVRTVSFGSPLERALDLRPVNRYDDDKPEEVKSDNPKSGETSSIAPHVPEKLPSDEDEKKKSQTPSSETSTAAVTQGNSSAGAVPSVSNAKITDESTESKTDSGVGSTSQTEEKSSSTSTQKPPVRPTPPAPIGKK